MQLFIPTIIGILLIGSLNVPSAGEYLGCFPANDITEHRKMMNDNNMTISICSENCHKSGFKIYGLRYGSHCYCFNNDSRSFNKSRVDERQCNTHCKGGPKCGGDLVIAITKLSSSFSGCFNYTPNDTLYFGGKLNKLTPKVCRDKCHYFQFFGLTQGSKCYCLSSIPEILRAANASCMKDGVWCVGGERCGGSGFIAIWNYITTEKENDPVTTTAPLMSSSTSIAWSSPGSQDSSNDEGGRNPFAWITIEITEGITWLFVILVIISFILGGVTVIGLVLLIQKYRSHKILMEVRRRLRDTEKRTKVNEREENGSSVEDLSKPKKDIMPNMDSEYSQVNRKAQTKTSSVLSSETTPQDVHDTGYDDDDVATKSDTKDKDTTRHPTSIQETKVTLNEVNEHGDEENHCRNGINSSSSTEYKRMKQDETSPLQRNFAGMDNTYAVVDKKTHPKRFDETRL
ncbi:uncharacterized protein [Apostichopus japonicus]|uniref:uncharacterized protein isoform X2 n=1 Tax=Stichopus japonicus TaxID=307972 RepID=UPI003AB1F8A0